MKKSARSLHNADLRAGSLLTTISAIQRSFVGRPLLGVWLLTLLFSSVAARSSLGTLRGTVTALGATKETLRVAGATVKLTGSATGSPSLTAVSNDDGDYKFSDLNPGLYTLEIASQGFANQTRKILLRPGQTTVEDIRLELAEVKSNVTVTADGTGVH